ncbi:ABC transporter substrate-binding protein [Jannaschia marina]|uniref:ABC transporter substrate-binding protein n=1 Tax=Jannaschia marina TaxID=2741674 RepID=UPI0015CA5609|nr:ABC transporter substrate-binding protein [Jannaschia marina]
MKTFNSGMKAGFTRTASVLALGLVAGAAMADGHAAYLTDADNVPSEDQRGGTLVAGFHIPLTHPNGAVASGLRNIVGTQIHAGLIRLNDDYEPIPYLANEWGFSEDGLQFNVELNENAVFHDGEQITCTDVAFSIATSQANHPFKSMFAPVSSVDGGDSTSCTINLDAPHPALLMALTPGLLPIIPEHIFNDGQEMPTHPRLTQDIVGSGPFRVTEWNGQDIVRLERFEDFFIDGLPYLDEIVLDIVQDQSTLALGLESGQYDMISIWSGDDVVRFQGDDRFNVIDQGFEAIGSIPWLQINVRDEVLSDPRVRQALWLAYDFEEYNDVVYAGQHRRQCTGIQSQSPFYNADAECYDRDVEASRALLAEAGYPDGLELTISTFPGQLQTGAEVLQRQFAEAGITLNIDVKPDEVTLLNEVTAEDSPYQLSLVGLWNWGDPVIGVSRSYVCDNRRVGVAFSNMSWYCNEEVDAVFAEAAQTVDLDARRDLYFQVQDMLNADVPVIPLTNEVWYTPMQLSVQNPPNGVWGWMDSWAETWIQN